MGERRYSSLDNGAILLRDGAAWQNEGQLTYLDPQVKSDSELQSYWVNVTGYPVDRPAGTMWWDSDSIRAVYPNQLFCNTDTADGQSGAPVWVKDAGGNRFVVGIHNYAGNYGSRINVTVLSNINHWKTEV